MKNNNQILWFLVLTQLVVGCRFGEAEKNNRARRAGKTTAEDQQKAKAAAADAKAAADKAKADADKAKADAEAKSKADADSQKENATSSQAIIEELSINTTKCDADMKAMTIRLNDKVKTLLFVDQIPNGKSKQAQTQSLISWNEESKKFEVIHNVVDKNQTAKENINFSNFEVQLKKNNDKNELSLKLKNEQSSIVGEQIDVKKDSDLHKSVCQLIKSSNLSLINSGLAQLKIQDTDANLIQFLSGFLIGEDKKPIARLSLKYSDKQLKIILQKGTAAEESIDYTFKTNSQELKLEGIGELTLNADNQVVLKLPKNSKILSKLGFTSKEEVVDVVLGITTVVVENAK